MSSIKKNDKVEVLSGREKGRQGKVLKILKEKNMALVERVNMVKRHTKPGGKAGQQGGIIEKEAPLKLSKLMVVCPNCAKTTRIGSRVLEDGERVRYCKKCSEQIEG